MNNFYDKHEVAKRLDIPLQRPQFYVNNGLLSNQSEGPGRGAVRLYSYDNLFEMAVIKRLNEMNIGLELVKRIFKAARDACPELLQLATYAAGNHQGGLAVIFYLDGRNKISLKGYRKGHDAAAFFKKIEKYDGTLIINLAKIAEELPI